jgi:hypothetical protein
MEMSKNCCRCCKWCNTCEQICLECFTEEIEFRKHSKLSAFPVAQVDNNPEDKFKDGDISPM